MDLNISQDTEDLEYYLVGGAVRDKIMGKNPKDYDFMVVGETEESMKERGFNHIPASSAKPVFFDDKKREFALARKETKKDVGANSGHSNFEFETDGVKVREDLKRRDFTINAMAKSKDDDIIDPFGGEEDIEKGVIRHVSEAFKEDALRVIRMARFAARLDFDIANETIKIAKETAPQIERDLPPERKGEALKKGLKQSKEPSRFLSILKEVDAYKYISDDIYNLSRSKHWEETLELVDKMDSNIEKMTMAFFHNIDKPNESNVVNRLKEDISMSKENRRLAKSSIRITNNDPTTEEGILDIYDEIDSNENITKDMCVELLSNKGYEEREVRNMLEEAEEAFEQVDGNYVMSKYDVSGKEISEKIRSERVSYLS